MCWNASNRSFRALVPGGIEVYAVYMLQDIDAGWRLANLKYGMRVVAEIGGRESSNRCPISSQCAIDCFAILNLGANKKIEIFGRTWLSIGTDGVSSDDQVFNLVFVEREQELPEIFG